ncbi:MAG: outer membrane protein assembly factor BamB family protein, partial [Planctomycetota bacterium]
MKTKLWFLAGLALCLSVSNVLSVVEAGTSGYDREARQIIDATGVKGGLIVHLGCGDGKLTAALGAGENYLVHGLDTDAQAVRRARRHIRKLGVYGPVSVEKFDGKRLPYVDNLANLVVAEDFGGVAKAEAMRVLAPGGVLYVKQDGRWTKTIKPRPKNTDEWTHFLHDASGNAVAHDEVVGPPRYVQWIAEPMHTRGHEHTPSINALVSAGGRIFYIADEASIASLRQTPKWHLVARDAYNGILLWKRPFNPWFPHIFNWGAVPRQLQRRLVAVGDRIYVTLGLHAPLSAVDAATGEVVKVYEKTRGTEEIVYHKGILLLAIRSVTDERTSELNEWAQLVKQKHSPLYVRETAQPLVNRFRAVENKAEETIIALDADTGRLLWKKTPKDVTGLRPVSLCAIGERVFYQKGKDVVCLNLKTGRQQWSVSSAPLRVVCADNVVCADGRTVTALSAETGKSLWSRDGLLTEIRDAFVVNGSLWLGGFKPIKGKRGPVWG